MIRNKKVLFAMVRTLVSHTTQDGTAYEVSMHVAKGVAESLRRRGRLTFGREQPLQYLGLASRRRGADDGDLETCSPSSQKTAAMG